MANLAKEDYRAAEEPLMRALRMKPDYVDAEAALALLHARAERYDDSLRLAQQIQRQYPTLHTGYAVEGDCWMAQQNFAAAERAYAKAFARRKSDVLATKLHSASSQAGRVKEANEKMSQWLREHPTETAARLYLADAYVKARQNQQAIDQYQQVLRSDPKNLLALNNLAALYRLQNDPRALEFLEESYKVKPENATVAGNLGWVLVERGELARGLELLSKAAARAPDNTEIGFHLAAALAKSGRKAQARHELERLLGANRQFQHRSEAQALLKQL
jgi:putative PEP-CTERM system TPR-repeat lipoprotein